MSDQSGKSIIIQSSPTTNRWINQTLIEIYTEAPQQNLPLKKKILKKGILINKCIERSKMILSTKYLCIRRSETAFILSIEVAPSQWARALRVQSREAHLRTDHDFKSKRCLFRFLGKLIRNRWLYNLDSDPTTCKQLFKDNC